MKNDFYFRVARQISTACFIVLVTSALMSCSDKLSERKAQTALENRFKEYMPNAPLNEGDNLHESKNTSGQFFAGVKKLDKLGFVDYDSLSTEYGSVNYRLHLTKDGRKYVLESKKRGDVTVHKMKLGNLKVDKIISIYENPSTNTAVVRALLRLTDRTPFTVLASDTVTTIERDFNFAKTNNGWEAYQ